MLVGTLELIYITKEARLKSNAFTKRTRKPDLAMFGKQIGNSALFGWTPYPPRSEPVTNKKSVSKACNEKTQSVGRVHMKKCIFM